MNKELNGICKLANQTINDVLNNAYFDAPIYEKSNRVCNEIKTYIPMIRNAAIDSMTEVYNGSNGVKNFEDKYITTLQEDFQPKFYLMLEKIYNQYKTFNHSEIQECIKRIIAKEFSYVYKNIQYIVAKELKLNVNFVASDSSCNVCKFVARNNTPTDDFICVDSCDSYFIRPAEIFDTDNLISNDIKFFNVPKKYKNSIASFYKMIKIRYPHMIKTNVKIKFITEYDLKDKFNDLADKIQFCFDSDSNEYVIVFDEYTYRHFILRAILDNSNVDSLLQEMYYRRISKDVIFTESKFISYLAEQNEQEFFYESAISYILNPNALFNIDVELYKWMQSAFEREVVI